MNGFTTRNSLGNNLEGWPDPRIDNARRYPLPSVKFVRHARPMDFLSLMRIRRLQWVTICKARCICGFPDFNWHARIRLSTRKAAFAQCGKSNAMAPLRVAPSSITALIFHASGTAIFHSIFLLFPFLAPAVEITTFQISPHPSRILLGTDYVLLLTGLRSWSGDYASRRRAPHFPLRSSQRLSAQTRLFFHHSNLEILFAAVRLALVPGTLRV